MNSGLLSGWRNRQPPWWGDQDGGANALYDVGSLAVGRTSISPAGTMATIGGAPGVTISDGSTYNVLSVGQSVTFDTVANGNYNGLNLNPSVIASANIASYASLQFLANLSGGGTATTFIGIQAVPRVLANTTATTATGIKSNITASQGTITTGYGVDIQSSNSLGTISTMVGLRIAGLAGSTIWGMQVGNYNSYLSGLTTFGSTNTPNVAADVDGSLATRVQTFTATNGNNNDCALTKSFVKITGPTGAFTITGIANGFDGKRIVLYNATTQNMSITNADANSAVGNRIATNTGGTLATTGTGTIELIYDGATSVWIPVSALAA